MPFSETPRTYSVTSLQMETSKAVMEPKAETSKAVMEPKAETSKAVMEPKAETCKAVMEPKAETCKAVMEPKADEPKLEVVKKKFHTPHSFEWTTRDKKPTIVTCKEDGTVENSLRQSSQFRKLEGKMKENKELVVLRGGKVISPHFPCSLIQQGERLTVEYVKAPEKVIRSADRPGYAPRGSSDQYVVFNVLPKGKKNVVKILRNTAIESLAQELTVYAYKGEKVKHALKRDGRFQETIFEKTCALDDIITNAITEMSNLVDDLDGKTFQIILLDKSRPPDSQPDSLDDTYTVQSESPSDLKENSDPSLSSAPAETDEKPQLKEDMRFVLPDTQEMRKLLCSQLKDWATTAMKGKTKSVPRFLRTEFGKNCEPSFDVKTGKILMHWSESVCQVRLNGKPAGSGFLLFDTYVLTNVHVLKHCFDPVTWQLCGEVTVHFSFESLDQPEVGHQVTEVVGYEYKTDESGYMHDWALLSLCQGQTLPDGLLTHFGECPPGGRIYIIGHPYGGVKKIDPCWIIPIKERKKAFDEFERIVQIVTHTFFEKIDEKFQFNPQILTYDTCFYFLSSGSPVFDSKCKVVAMHTGGYAYKTTKGRGESIIEYGYPLSAIIPRMKDKLEERELLYVLERLKFFEPEPEPMDCD